MKKTSKKLNRILLLAALVLLIAAMGLVMASCRQEEAATSSEPVLYWNVEGEDYRSGKLTRMANGEDGYVYMIFAKDGEQIRLPVQDLLLANKIDMLKCVGLVINADGVVVDAVRVEDFTGGFQVEEHVVTAIEGNKITCNSSGLMDGYESSFEITDETPVYNVGGTGITVGIPWTVGVDDLITVIKNEDGSIMCVYTEPYEPPQDIYWNVERFYDSKTKLTTREMDATGKYVVTLTCNGETKDFVVRDHNIVQDIDEMAAKCFGLEFDAEGNISRVIHAGTAAGGGSCASWYHCTSLDGLNAGFTRVSGSNLGAAYDGPLSKDCKIYDVSGNGEYVGEPTDLRVGDQVHCLKDNRNRICVVYVVNRKVDSEIYWNIERKYDSKTAKTTRRPAADGWYYIDVAVRGKQITVKTQDWDIANKIDGRAAKCFGLKLGADNVIEKFYTPDAVTGGSTFASWYDVTAYDGTNIEVVKNSNGDYKKGVVAADCEIYDVSASAAMVGAPTDIRVGDTVHTIKDFAGEITVCYVVTRYVDWPVYYNLDRKWSSTTNSTTRTPNADGYYVFRMAVDGQEVTLKTKSKSVANAIDKEAAMCLTMSVGADGTIYKAMHAKNTTICRGAASSSWTTVTELTKNGFVTYKSTGVIENEKYAWNAKVYNVSTNYIDHQGEETKLQVGDFVHCLTNRRGEITLVYIMTRPLNLPVYYNLDRMWDNTNSVSTRTPNANGEYEFKLAYGGGEVTLKTTDPQVVYDIDKEVAMCVALRVDDNGYITYATHAKNSVYCGGGIGMSYADVTEVNGNQVTVLKDGKYTTFTISDDCEMFVTKDIEGLTRGNYTTVRVGDFVHCLKDKDGNTNYMAIMSRVKQLPKVDHTCQHVTEDVTWYAWDGTAFPLSGHYVLTEDISMAERVTINAGVEITICLNGHTVTNPDRFFTLYGTLNICDHKDASGNYKGTLDSAYSGKVYGALAYVYNNKSDAELNIYGGNIVHSGEANNGAIVFLGQTADRTYTAVMNMYDGVITGGNSTAKGGAICISNYSIFNMYGGKITGNKSTGNGGAINVAQGEFNMFGGVISDNTATGNGGGVDNDAGTFNMTGGILENNKGAEGGNVRTGQNATTNVSGKAIVRGGSATGGAGGNFTTIGKLNIFDGATVSGGTCTSAGTAISAFANAAAAHAIVTIENATIDGTIRCDTGSGPVELFITDSSVTGQVKVGANNCSLTVEGKVNLSEVRLLDGKVIAIGENGLDDASAIKVKMDNLDKSFATITDPNDEKCFAPAEPDICKVVNKNNDLYLESTVKLHVHCACNGEAKGKPNHTCTDTEYLPWSTSDSLPTSGKYYLTTDVTVSSTYEIRSALNLCLNGHTITGSTRIYKIYSTFNLSDCAAKNADGSYKGKLIGNQTSTTLGPTFYLYSGGIFNLFGGELTVRSDSETAQAGVGGIQVGTMNMYGGKISGGNVTGKGGCICIFDNATVRLYGGEITGGKAAGGGGNIYISAGTLEIHEGATVSDGYTSNGTGGNILADTSANNHFLMDGGLVTRGETVATSDKSGGNMDIRCADAKIIGGTVSHGYAYEGGNIRVGNNGDLIIGGNAIIENGESKAAGGNLAVFKTLTIEGNAQIKNGTAGGSGGNISAYANAATAVATITVKGGTISGGTAVKDSGSIRLDANSGTVNVTFIGGTVEAGTASSYSCVKVGSAAGVHVTVGGTAKIASLGLSGNKTISISTDNPFQTGASIRLYMVNVGVFAENVTTDVSGFFTSSNSGKTPMYDAETKTMYLG